MAEHSGGELIARMLQAEGVDKVFGIIDGTYFGFYSALHPEEPIMTILEGFISIELSTQFIQGKPGNLRR